VHVISVTRDVHVTTRLAVHVINVTCDVHVINITLDMHVIN